MPTFTLKIWAANFSIGVTHSAAMLMAINIKKTNESRQKPWSCCTYARPLQTSLICHFLIIFFITPSSNVFRFLSLQSPTCKSLIISHYPNLNCIINALDSFLSDACTLSIIVNPDHICYYKIYNLSIICNLIFKRISTCLNEKYST